ncbi:hypothetical protein GIB67_028387 [Kingdonia uniflora]|uniref:RING-type E3 ubiquitin transferase n=1 Tax=Kingdonia uniflora TaxID=39325 RepID=A0A7J7MHV3_9MAGN|nr:hypothetical protein GIB67_028387 [Kingdonia uniflora]
MEATRSSNSLLHHTVDSTPLLDNFNDGGDGGNRDDERRGRFSPRSSLRGAARFFRRASSRRMMREPSMLVRETAAEQLEERQSDWAYSKPVVFLDIVWNLAFVVVAIAILVLSRNETPSMPLRVWILGYSLQCVLHIVFVCVEYRRRQCGVGATSGENERSWSSGFLSSMGSEEVREVGEYSVRPQQEENSSVAKHLESVNTMFSFIWWIVGFYWVSAGGQDLIRDSPQLYWLSIVFLTFDVFFVVFCIALACVIGIAVCCCLPCIIAILYAVTEQEGASKEDIDQLPKYIFRRVGNIEKLNGEAEESNGGIITECNTDAPIKYVLPLEDTECCICLSAYDDGAELHELPCGHRFHCACVDKWLLINATCPLCKYNILKSGSNSREEV